MIEILHDVMYQTHRNYGSIVYIGSCRILCHQPYFRARIPGFGRLLHLRLEEAVEVLVNSLAVLLALAGGLLRSLNQIAIQMDVENKSYGIWIMVTSCILPRNCFATDHMVAELC